jgi:hypothetical protein
MRGIPCATLITFHAHSIHPRTCRAELACKRPASEQSPGRPLYYLYSSKESAITNLQSWAMSGQPQVGRKWPSQKEIYIYFTSKPRTKKHCGEQGFWRRRRPFPSLDVRYLIQSPCLNAKKCLNITNSKEVEMARKVEWVHIFYKQCIKPVRGTNIYISDHHRFD